MNPTTANPTPPPGTSPVRTPVPLTKTSVTQAPVPVNPTAGTNGPAPARQQPAPATETKAAPADPDPKPAAAPDLQQPKSAKPSSGDPFDKEPSLFEMGGGNTAKRSAAKATKKREGTSPKKTENTKSSSDGHNQGTPRHPRTWSPNEPVATTLESGSGARILLSSGLLIAILAAAIIVMTVILNRTRNELNELRLHVANLNIPAATAPALSKEDRQRFTDLENGLGEMETAQGDLRTELSDTLNQSVLSLRSASREARDDRNAIRSALAVLMQRAGAGEEEIEALFVGLNEREKENLLALLDAGAPAGDPPAGDAPPSVLPPKDNGNEPTGNETTPPGPGDTAGTETGEESTGGDDPQNIEEGALPAVPVAADKIYVVKPGDNLSAIARDHKVDQKALMELNGIKNANLISVGMKLKIPSE